MTTLHPELVSFMQWMLRLWVSRFTAAYFFLGNLFNLTILLLGYYNSRKQYAASNVELIKKLAPLRTLTPISMLVPSYNEELSILDSVRSMLSLDYPAFEVIVCNDGSKDNTLALLMEEFKLVATPFTPPMTIPTKAVKQAFVSTTERRLIVLDKANGGKADALNACINFSRYPLVCCVDSDSLLDGDGLARISMPFFEDPERTIAVGGTISIIGDGDQGFSRSVPFTWMGMIQALEYLRAFLVGRMGWDYLGCTTIISGAFGLFKKSALVRVGGYMSGSIGEDMEVLLRMHAYFRQHKEPYRVCFLPDPVCWTEAPSDFETLGKQRSRWHQGLCDGLWRTRNLIMMPGGGLISWVAMPYLVLFECISPIVEVLTYMTLVFGFVLGLAPWRETLLLILVTKVFGIVMNMCSIVIDQLTYSRYDRSSDLLKLMLGGILEQVSFRQIHLYWRLRGIYRWLKGGHNWGEMKRRGFRTTPPPAKAAATPAISSKSAEPGSRAS